MERLPTIVESYNSARLLVSPSHQHSGWLLWWCKMCRTRIWARNKSTGRCNLVLVSCRRWSCPHCAKALVALWSDHFRDCTSSLPRVHRCTIETADWDRLYQRLHRGETRYFSVCLSPTRRAVYSDKPIGEPTDESLTTDNAAVRFRRDVANYDHRLKCAHPVTTCREWKRLKRIPKYELVSKTVTRPETLRSVAADMDVPVKEWNADLCSGVEVLTTGDVLARLIARCEREERRNYARRQDRSIPNSWTDRRIPSGSVPIVQKNTG